MPPKKRSAAKIKGKKGDGSKKPSKQAKTNVLAETTTNLSLAELPSVLLDHIVGFIPGIQSTRVPGGWYYHDQVCQTTIFSIYLLPVMLVNKTLLKSARAVQFTNIRHKGKLPTLEEIARIKDKVLKLDLAYLEPEFNKVRCGIWNVMCTQHENTNNHMIYQQNPLRTFLLHVYRDDIPPRRRS